MSDYIKKLYELAKVNNTSLILKEKWIGSTMKVDCELIKPYNFTAEKQLELIKLIQLLDNIDNLQMFHHELNNKWCFIVEMLPEFSNIPTERLHCSHEDFEQALASLIMELWKDLSDEQRKKFKHILDTTKN